MKELITKYKFHVIFTIFISLICCQFYFYYTNNGNNTSLVISNQQYNNNDDIVILFINDVEMKTINMNGIFVYNGSFNLALGKNKIMIKNLINEKVFQRNIYFFGTVSWNLIEFNDETIIYERCFFPPTFE